jgi:5-hydroxyisourate hydrolase
MSAITTHILDVSKGSPASGVAIVLEYLTGNGNWLELGRGETDEDGRLKNLLSPESAIQPGAYRLTFETGKYFESQGVESFYPQVCVTFLVSNAAQHYHVPLLLSPYGFTTYRGS